MENLKKVLDSGAELYVDMVPFELGHRLLKVVAKELSHVKFAFGNAEVDDVSKLKDILKSDDAIDTIKNVIMRAICSDDIEDILWQCMAYSTYNKIKIVKENKVFDSVASRGDYLIVAKEVLWFNLSPFFKNLSSLLSQLPQRSTSTQSS